MSRQSQVFGIAGCGVIGAGWAARALHVGIDVVAFDVDGAMESRLRAAIEHARPALESLTEGMALPARGSLSFTTDLKVLASAAGFIQENIPEQLELKRDFFSELSASAGEDVLIASSTSGFMPSEIQKGMTHPGRMLVGHPFNPVYLIPLVEVVGGAQTSPQALEQASKLYLRLGMHPLRVRREVPGHLSDRLQEALWRENLHALNDDIATTRELDEALVYGPGLRWALMGVNQVYMLGGGEGGAKHFLEQFGPALEFPWTHLKAPVLDEALAQKFVEGTKEQAEGRSIRELERVRDECIVAIQKVLRRHNIGAGRALNQFAETLEKNGVPSG
ncbi:MAG: 3-hydroxyacyl-CoA dehydrogenase NAD-binding domain-containing protein [Hyphomicrobiales bacterium]|nr:3-hydroxyacyl-CoA dehydrogenase NAD-binding domain-containing protein [Hyphomicrobiales bacterium]